MYAIRCQNRIKFFNSLKAAQAFQKLLELDTQKKILILKRKLKENGYITYEPIN